MSITERRARLREGRQTERGSGPVEEGLQERRVWRSGPEDGTPGRVLGRFPHHPPTSAPSKGNPAPGRPETPRFWLPPRRGQADRHCEPRAGPEPTSCQYPCPQRRGGRAGARKWPRQNSPRPPEEPTTPPASLSLSRHGPARDPPPRPPRGSRRGRAGSTGTRVGVNGGARGKQGAQRGVTRQGPAP